MKIRGREVFSCWEAAGCWVLYQARPSLSERKGRTRPCRSVAPARTFYLTWNRLTVHSCVEFFIRKKKAKQIPSFGVIYVHARREDCFFLLLLSRGFINIAFSFFFVCVSFQIEGCDHQETVTLRRSPSSRWLLQFLVHSFFFYFVINWRMFLPVYTILFHLMFHTKSMTRSNEFCIRHWGSALVRSTPALVPYSLNLDQEQVHFYSWRLFKPNTRNK